VTAQLLHLDRWRALTDSASEGAHRGGRWEVSFPILDKGATELRFSVPEVHGHYRHPQVLQLTIDGALVEVVGCHLKSKINTIPVPPPSRCRRGRRRRTSSSGIRRWSPT
jgi:hypothetical protein